MEILFCDWLQPKARRNRHRCRLVDIICLYDSDIFKKYDKYDIAAASLFLAAKVEENPRKVEHVLKAREEWTRKGKEGERPGPLEIDTQSEDYQRKLNRLIDHEVPFFNQPFPNFAAFFW